MKPTIKGGVRQEGDRWFAIFKVQFPGREPEEWQSQPFTSKAAAMASMRRRAEEIARRNSGYVREVV